MCTHKIFLYFLALFLFTFNIDAAVAQNAGRKNRTLQTDGTMQANSAAAANLPDALKGADLSQVNVDQLSDAQIAALQSQLQSSGLSIEQAEQLALAKGMPASEWQKLKNRIQALGKPNQNTEPQTVASSQRQTVNSDMKVYQRNNVPEVFGSALFTTPSLSFEPNLRIATPVNYVLGPDDEMLINVSGYQETNIRTTVQPEGTVFIPQVGSISVNGLTIEQATARIRDKMAQTVYPSLRNGSSKLIVSLGKIRSITITILGAAKPGNYTVSSLATVFNSLYMCGGPGDINTYRDIELIRGNKVIQRIDLYQFLTKGDQRGNIPLRENDVINFPVYKKHVLVQGEVKRPGIFELKEGETLDNLLFFAGGFTDKAYKATIKVKQITDTERKIRDIAKADFASYQPENGDEVQVNAVLDRVENAVTINGAVYRPGEFELTPGLTLSELIKRAGGLQENVFTDRAVLTHVHPDGTLESIPFNVRAILNGTVPDIQLQKRDNITIAQATDFKSNYTVNIQGEVRKAGQYPFKENLSLKDLLFTAGGFTDAASAYNIEVGRRLINDRTSKNIDTIATVYNLSTDKELALENDRFILQPYDIVTVRRNPGYTEQQRVTINGEVNFPGSYTIQSKNERISSLIKRSGGLTPFAYTNGVFLIRNNTETDTTNQQNIRNIQTSIKDTSAKVNEDIAKPNNRIAVNLKAIMKHPGGIEDYVLQDGDEIEVLKLDPLVKVSGEVLSSTKTGFVSGKGMHYYLSEAGGTTDNARRSKIYVIYANGSINRTKNGVFGIFRSYPKVKAGAEVVVPRKVERPQLSTTEKVSFTTAIVSMISLIIVAISNLKK